MDLPLRELAPQMIALLVGGLAASLGPAWAARSRRFQPKIAKLGRPLFTLLCLIVAAVGIISAYALVLPLLETATLSPASTSTARLFLLGLAVGLPLALPGIVAGRAEAVRRERVRKEREERTSTREDRVKYAEELVGQIREISPDRQDVEASLEGKDGRILRLSGTIGAREGERLTAALREDLAAVGFRRVEGGSGSAKWWSRV